MKSKEQNKYAGVYEELVEQFGLEVVTKLYENFRGQQVVFPMRFYKRDYVVDQLKARYTGDNLKILAMEFGYTERYLRALLEQEKSYIKEKEIKK